MSRIHHPASKPGILAKHRFHPAIPPTPNPENTTAPHTTNLIVVTVISTPTFKMLAQSLRLSVPAPPHPRTRTR